MHEDAEIYGLAYNCPANKEESDCPFNEVKNLSFAEKVQWVNSLSEEMKKVICEHHKTCTKIQQ